MTTKSVRGQFFTTDTTVQEIMLSLIQTKNGIALEPSCGAGDLVKRLETRTKHTIHAVELDSTIEPKCFTKITYQDFFSFSEQKEEHYDLIYGNPPYVAWKNLEEGTKQSASKTKSRYNDKTNLYHLFIDRSIDLLKPEGELIFIVPKGWLYTSSAIVLRNKILETGNLTHIIDCGEQKLFPDADVPALLIFRYEKRSQSLPVKFAYLQNARQNKYSERKLINTKGRFILLNDDTAEEIASWGRLKDNYDVKVGIISGADSAFRAPSEHQLEKESIRKYITTKGVEEFIDLNSINKYEEIPPKTQRHLKAFKNELLNRRIKSFNETNWWKYGAIRNIEAMESDKERFYALAKTRSRTPFFMNNEAKYYSGGILGIFSTGNIQTEQAIKILNSDIYRQILESMFLTTGNKVSLQPATLEDAPFPKTADQAQKFIKKHSL